MVEIISEVLGKTLKEVTKHNENMLIFKFENGETYKMFHDQNCCESVYIEDIIGDLNDLVGVPLLKADIKSSNIDLYQENNTVEEWMNGSENWTYYTFATIKGYVDIRWYGSSNGYYSTGVDFLLEK